MEQESSKGNYAENMEMEIFDVTHFTLIYNHSTNKASCQPISHSFHTLWKVNMGFVEYCVARFT